MTQNNTALTNEPDHNEKFLFKHKIELIRGEKDFLQINGRIFLRKKRNCEAQLIDDNLV